MTWTPIIPDAALTTSVVISKPGGMTGKRKRQPAPLFQTDLRSSIDALTGLLEVDLDAPPVDVMTLGLLEIHVRQEGRERTTITYLGGGWIRVDGDAGDRAVRRPDALMHWLERHGLPA